MYGDTPVGFELTVVFGLLAILVVFCLTYKSTPAFARFGKEASKVDRSEFLNESPLIKSNWLSSSLSSGNNVYLKLDSLQPTGSNLIRGISSFMKREYLNDKRIDTFITTSISNEGIATAYTAMKLNCKCLIILPLSMKDSMIAKEEDDDDENNERQKALFNTLEQEYGAEIQYHDSESLDDTDEYAQRLGQHENKNYCYVPSERIATPLIYDGYTGIIREIQQEELEDSDNDDVSDETDCIVISCDNGGLLGGILGGLYQCGWRTSCKIVAAQSENNALFQAAIDNSFKPYPVNVISPEGKEMGHRVLPEKIARLSSKFEDFNPIKSIIVKDLDILNVSTLFAEKEHLLINSQSAIAVAAVYKNKHYFKQFKNIVIIINSGNNPYYNTKLLYKSIKNGKFNDKQTKFDIIGTTNIKQQMKRANIFDDDDDRKEEDEDGMDYEFDLDEIDNYDSQTEEM